MATYLVFDLGTLVYRSVSRGDAEAFAKVRRDAYKAEYQGNIKLYEAQEVAF